MYFVENQQKYSLDAAFKIQNVINVHLNLKQCNKREKLGREAAQFFSFITLFQNHFHIHKKLNFKKLHSKYIFADFHQN